MEAKIRLKTWADAQGIKQGKLAELLGITQQTVSEILSGRSSPSLRVAITIEAKTGILAKEWLSEAERKKLESAPTLPPPAPEVA